ncbi:hypothetical protein MRY87_03945 [bacterium]|nr:hypothetical protein [bacterium]
MTRVEIPQDLQSEWYEIEKAFAKIVYLPRFLVFIGRQISRLPDDAVGSDLPGVALSSLCENIRRSGSFQVGLYNASRELYPEKLAESEELRIRHMVRWFTPQEIFAVVLLIYFNRYLHMRCPPETWAGIEPYFRRDVALGYQVGHAYGALNTGKGMLLGGIRRIAQGFLVFSHKKTKGDILLRLMNIGLAGEKYTEAQRERELCGYSHLLVAAYIAQKCGMGVPPTSAFSNQQPYLETLAKGMKKGEGEWGALRYIFEQIKEGKSAQQCAADLGLSLSGDGEDLDGFAQSLSERNDLFSWLGASKEQLSEITEHTILDVG